MLSVAGPTGVATKTRKQLTRLWRHHLPKQKELDEHLHLLEEAKKRDHRKLGKELDPSSLLCERVARAPDVAAKGYRTARAAGELRRPPRTRRLREQVVSPHIGSKQPVRDQRPLGEVRQATASSPSTPRTRARSSLLKPELPAPLRDLRQPAAELQDLPLRLAEFGTVYRYEQSGELHGLTRVRGFTQDDAHLFCRPDQVKEEFKKVIDLVLQVLKALDLNDFEAQISLRDQVDRSKYIGSDENWEKASRPSSKPPRKRAEDGGGIRRGRLLRPQAGLHGAGRPAPEVAAGHHPGGLQPAGAF